MDHSSDDEKNDKLLFTKFPKRKTVIVEKLEKMESTNVAESALGLFCCLPYDILTHLLLFLEPFEVIIFCDHISASIRRLRNKISWPTLYLKHFRPDLQVLPSNYFIKRAAHFSYIGMMKSRPLYFGPNILPTRCPMSAEESEAYMTSTFYASHQEKLGYDTVYYGKMNPRSGLPPIYGQLIYAIFSTTHIRWTNEGDLIQTSFLRVCDRLSTAILYTISCFYEQAERMIEDDTRVRELRLRTNRRLDSKWRSDALWQQEEHHTQRKEKKNGEKQEKSGEEQEEENMIDIVAESYGWPIPFSLERFQEVLREKLRITIGDFTYHIIPKQLGVSGSGRC